MMELNGGSVNAHQVTVVTPGRQVSLVTLARSPGLTLEPSLIKPQHANNA
jgi:hypothetical protein